MSSRYTTNSLKDYQARSQSRILQASEKKVASRSKPVKSKEKGQKVTPSTSHVMTETSYQQAFESLVAFSAILRRRTDLSGFLADSLAEIIRLGFFKAGLIVSANPTWPALCSVTAPTADESLVKRLAELGALRLDALLKAENQPEVQLRVVEDPTEGSLGLQIPGIVEFPISIADRPVALLLVSFDRGQPPESQQLRLTGAMLQMLEAALQHRSLGSLDDGNKPAGKPSHLETLGRLAAGVAHDFNNLLQGMLGYTSLMEMSFGKGNPKATAYLEGLEKEVMKGGSLSEQLLSLARGGSSVAEFVDLNELVRETVQLMERTFDRRIEIATHLPTPGIMLLAVKSDLVQAITTLCLNARDSLPAGGRITISVTKLATAELPLPVGCGLSCPQSVCFEIGSSATETPVAKLSGYLEYTSGMSDATSSENNLQQVQVLARRHQGFLTQYADLARGKTTRLYIPVKE